MAKSWSCWRFSRRALVSALALCLLAWQALVAVQPPRPERLAGFDAPTSVTTFVDAHCDGHDRERSPADHRHSDCCLFCGACGRDGSLSLALAELATARIEAPSPAPVSLARHFGDGPVLFPLGWTSSWSSRAPPLV